MQKGTLTKFPSVFVEPLEHVYTSSIPAIDSTFLGTRAATIPAPRGAGMSLTITLPHFPVTLVGTVCGAPILLPQYPLLTGTTDILAKIIAPLIAVATCIQSESQLSVSLSSRSAYSTTSCLKRAALSHDVTASGSKWQATRNSPALNS